MPHGQIRVRNTGNRGGFNWKKSTYRKELNAVVFVWIFCEGVGGVKEAASFRLRAKISEGVSFEGC